jgi:hypothetical protein
MWLSPGLALPSVERERQAEPGSILLQAPGRPEKRGDDRQRCALPHRVEMFSTAVESGFFDYAR